MSDPALLEQLDVEELWALLDQATVGVWKWDLATDQVSWSRSIHRTLGTTPGGDSGVEYVREIVHPDDRDRFAEALESSRRPGGIYSIELRLRKHDGEYIGVGTKGIWLPLSGDAVETLLGFIIDMSEVHQARVALRRSEARFRSFFDHAPVAAYLKDSDFVHLYGNQAAADIAGMSLDDFIGLSTRDAFPQEVADRLLAVDRRVLDGHTVETWSGRVSSSDGRERFVYDIKFPVQDIASDELLVGGFGVDVTEQTLAQERLQAAQRLESLGVLAGGVAHDFNNLLVGILGNAELATESAPEDTPRLLRGIIDTAQRASELCEQLLAYAGRSMTRRVVVNVSDFIRDTQDLLTMSTRELCTLEYALDAEAPNVNIDPGQLRQIILNLVMNAAQASAGPGRAVRVSCDSTEAVDHGGATVIHDWTSDNGPFTRIRVQDTGGGLTPETAGRIFDPFFTTRAEGHGLGLAAVLGIIKASKGAIRVDSAPREGTRVSVFVPGTVEAAAERKEPPAPAQVSLAGRVLVVDDEVSVADVCRMLLERMGLTVDLAYEGPDAIRSASESPPDLVLLDLTMPHMSGVEVLHAIRENAPELPVILSSGYTKDDVSQVLDERTVFLRKPYTARELKSLVNRLMTGLAPSS